MLRGAKFDPEEFFDLDDGFGFTSPVGAIAANSFGLHDMLGNVREYCADDWHDSYKELPTNSTAWTTGGSGRLRVLRGGSWSNDPWGVRSGTRNRNNDRITDTGFFPAEPREF